MSILSFSFVAFLLAAMLVYFLTPGKYQWISLLVISYGFYMFAGVRAILFILITTTSTYLAGRWIGKINDEYDVQRSWPGYAVIGGIDDTLWAYNPSKGIYCQIDSCNTGEDTYYTISDSFEEFLIKMDEELA